MANFRQSIAGAALLLAAALGPAVPATAQDELPKEGTVEAFTSWEASGHVYPTGPAEATFVGVLSGILYVRDETGTIDAGLITCPVTVTVDTGDGSQTGEAKCVIATPENARFFGRFHCEGVFLEGCNGEFEITGGTGPLEGIEGGGRIELKSAFAHVALVPGNIVDQTAAGLALWPALTYKLP